MSNLPKKNSSKATIALLAVSLTLGSVTWAPASTAEAASGTRFPDVSASHWANKHITKLSLLGIVQGNEKGQYEPEASVTQEQVITMAIRMMGLEEYAKGINVASYGTFPFQVSDYAKRYIIAALEKGLILYKEELDSSNTGSGPWGTRKATREWVAKLSIRAIGMGDKAEALSNKPTPFTDNNAVSSWATGFINKAVELKIVTGMEDGSFKPQNPVTRAQMATFLSRAGGYAEAPANSVTGTLQSVGTELISLAGDDGKIATYTLNQNSLLFGLNGAVTNVSSLKTYSRVFMILAQGQIQYLEVLEEESQANNKLEGVLLNVNTNQESLTLQVYGQPVLAELQNPPTILDLEGRSIPLSTLEPGWTLEITRTSSRAKYSSITVKRIPLNKTAEGTVQRLDLTERKLYVQEKDKGAAVYPLAANVQYTPAVQPGDLTEVKAKDVIRYKVTNDLVTQIDMVKVYEEPNDTGKMVEIRSDKDLSFITLQKPDKKYATYALAPGADVVINGVENPVYRDLVAGDQVKVMLTDANEVYRILVTNRSLKTEFMNTIVSYDKDYKALTVLNAAGQISAYQLSDSTQFIVDTTEMPLSSATTFLVKGRKLDVTASSDTNVKTLRVIYGYEGVLSKIDTTKREVTVKVGEYPLTFPYTNPVTVELPFKANAQPSELTVGDRIKISFNATQDQVNKLQVVRTATQWLVNVNQTGRLLTLKNEAGVHQNVALSSTTKLMNLNMTEIPLTELIPDDPLFINYLGTTIDKVVVPTVSRGRITAADQDNGSITIQNANGNPQTIKVGSTVVVKKEGTAGLFKLDAVKAGDRVILYKDQSGAFQLVIAQAIQKKVQSYDAANRKLNVLREQITEPTFYTIHSQGYLHKAGQTLASNGLAANDVVTLYIINGTIVELEKQ